MQATVLDRAYGAGTMILHIKGTMHPNAPIRPEYMKTSVYIPPVIVNKIPIWEQLRIINIAQEFLQVIGTRTVRNFQDAVRQRDWKYSQFGAQPRANRPLYKLPRPIGSVQYIIPGHAVHQIAASGDTSHSHDLSASGSTSHSHDLSASYDASPSHDSSALAERENDQLREHLMVANGEISRLKSRIQDLEAEVLRCQDRTIRNFPCGSSSQASSLPSTSVHQNRPPVPFVDDHLPESPLPSTLARRYPPPVPFDDDQLPVYRATPLHDAAERHNLTSHIDTIMNVAKHVSKDSWGCTLGTSLNIDNDVITELVNVMKDMELN